MCGDPNGWMCDECFTKMRDSATFGEKDFCETCRDVMSHMCFCCMTRVEDPSELHPEERICKFCQKEVKDG